MGKLAYDLGSLDISGELKETDDGWQTDQPLTQSQFSQLSSLSVRFNGNLDLPTPPGVNSFQQGNNIFANYITIEPDAGQPVTVYYRDENGDDLAPAETLTGSVGQNYQTTAKEFPDYQLKKGCGKYNRSV
ncbi:MucBP domain-containing protein [Fructilactobacillus florum]|uniref:MucBP domain-containing protein n=1 Tax=Fructilactobacillus florum TaxID=640331 RepID=UPI0034E2B805